MIYKSIICLIFLTLFAPPSAYAHKLMVDCTLKNNLLIIEAFYERSNNNDNDPPARHAKVSIIDSENNTVLTGLTDDLGRWHGHVDRAGEYTVRVESVGHRAQAKIQVVIQTAASIQSVPTMQEPPTTTGSDLHTGRPIGRLAIGLAIILVLSIVYSLFLRTREKRKERWESSR